MGFKIRICDYSRDTIEPGSILRHSPYINRSLQCRVVALCCWLNAKYSSLSVQTKLALNKFSNPSLKP